MAVVIIGFAALYLAGNGQVSLWDRDEAWYCQTSKQMVASGDWVIPHFLNKPRTAKPILIYWLQAASMSVFGPTEFAARFVSAAATTAVLIVLAITLTRSVGPALAAWTILIFASSGLVIATAKMCLIDSAMLLLITGMQICVYRLWQNKGAIATVIALWVLAGLAVLAKGPAPLVIVFTSMLLLAIFHVGRQWRSPAAWGGAVAWWRTLRPLWGLLIIVIVAGPWAVMALIRNPEFMKALLWEPGRHLTQNESGHLFIPGYFVATIWLTYFPWSLFLPAALVAGFRNRAQPHVRYALAIILGNWIFSELMATKLPHYMLPSYASLAFLTATALQPYMQDPMHRDLRTIAYKIGVAIWGIGGLVLACLPFLAIFWFRNFDPRQAATFTVMGAIYVGVVCRLLYRRQITRAAGAMAAGMLLLIAHLFLLYFPRAAFLRLPERAGTLLSRIQDNQPIFMVGYDEPSFAYYQGGTILAKDDNYLAKTDPQNWPTWIVTTGKVYDRLPPDRKAALVIVHRLRGMNYNTSQTVTELLIARKRLASASQPTTRKIEP